jgi:hypothetical protein
MPTSHTRLLPESRNTVWRMRRRSGSNRCAYVLDRLRLAPFKGRRIELILVRHRADIKTGRSLSRLKTAVI